MRTIKPSFFLDDDVGALPPLGRLLFIGLWCLADREGRLEDRPGRIKIQVLPYDLDVPGVDDLLRQLAEAKFIIRYEAGGARLIQIRTFSRHQRVHPNETASILPGAPGFRPTADALLPLVEGLAPIAEALASGSGSSGSGCLDPKTDLRSGSGCAEPDKPATAPTAKEPAGVGPFPVIGAPDFWIPPAKVAEWVSTFTGIVVIRELRLARQWLLDNPTRRKTPRGMTRFLFAWLAREQNRAPRVAASLPPRPASRYPTAEETAAFLGGPLCKP